MAMSASAVVITNTVCFMGIPRVSIFGRARNARTTVMFPRCDDLSLRRDARPGIGEDATCCVLRGFLAQLGFVERLFGVGAPPPGCGALLLRFDVLPLGFGALSLGRRKIDAGVGLHFFGREQL
jgi:hypothetical protein